MDRTRPCCLAVRLRNMQGRVSLQSSFNCLQFLSLLQCNIGTWCLDIRHQSIWVVVVQCAPVCVIARQPPFHSLPTWPVKVFSRLLRLYPPHFQALLCFCLLCGLQSVSLGQLWFTGNQTGMQMRAAACALVFEKATKLRSMYAYW